MFSVREGEIFEGVKGVRTGVFGQGRGWKLVQWQTMRTELSQGTNAESARRQSDSNTGNKKENEQIDFSWKCSGWQEKTSTSASPTLDVKLFYPTSNIPPNPRTTQSNTSGLKASQGCFGLFFLCHFLKSIFLCTNWSVGALLPTRRSSPPRSCNRDKLLLRHRWSEIKLRCVNHFSFGLQSMSSDWRSMLSQILFWRNYEGTCNLTAETAAHSQGIKVDANELTANWFALLMR